jgi:hypothetical protein
MTPVLLRVMAALLCATPIAAHADVTARYAVGEEVLVVEVDDGGDYRAGIEGKFALLRRGGAEYAVIYDAGSPTVLELRSFISFVQMMMKHELPSEAADVQFVLRDTGEAEVGGRKGRRWRFGRVGERGNPLEVVMSSDPALAPMGAVFRNATASMIQLFGQMLGAGGKTNFVPLLTELFAKGTPIRIEGPGIIELRSVTLDTIDPKRFELPGPVVDSSALMAGARASDEPGSLPPPLP